MIKDLVIIDDVFDNPERLVEISNGMTFYERHNHPDPLMRESHWGSVRTINLLSGPDAQEVVGFMNKAIEHTIFSNSPRSERSIRYEWTGRSFFHKIDESITVNDGKLHKDREVMAGVVYLNKTPKPNSGTIIHIGDTSYEIENRYNRLVLYRGDYVHRPAGGFGQGDDSRTTFLMFFDTLSFVLA